MKILTALVHYFWICVSREYEEKYLRETQTKICIDNIRVMRSRNDHPRDIIGRWVEKYFREYPATDSQVIAQCLLDEGNLYLAELAVKLNPALRPKAVEQILDAARAMRVNDDATGSYSSVNAIDFVATAYELAAQENGMLKPDLVMRMQSIIGRAAYIAVHLMPEDYPQMLYLKAHGFSFSSE